MWILNAPQWHNATSWSGIDQLITEPCSKCWRGAFQSWNGTFIDAYLNVNGFYRDFRLRDFSYSQWAANQESIPSKSSIELLNSVNRDLTLATGKYADFYQPWNYYPHNSSANTYFQLVQQR